MENLVLVPLLADNQSNSRLPDPKMNSLSLFTQTIILEDLEYSHMDQFYGTFLTFCGAFSIEFKFLGELKPVRHIIPPLHQRDPSQLLITSH